MTQPQHDLRTTLHRLADATEPLPVADDLWRRGHATQRRARTLAIAAALVVLASVGGGVLLLGQDREARTAAGEIVEGGAIPSRVVDPLRVERADSLEVGRASVAFASGDRAVVVTAQDGRYHSLPLSSWDGGIVSLSPDGERLAWTYRQTVAGQLARGLGIADLTNGHSWKGATTGVAEQVSWSPDSRWLAWVSGRAVGRYPLGEGDLESTVADNDVAWASVADDGTLRFDDGGYPTSWPVGGAPEPMDLNSYAAEQLAWGGNPVDRVHGAVASPTGNTVALATEDALPAADFLSSSQFKERLLATDLYPDGAAVRPLGWATDTLVLAEVDAPEGSYVEGRHLALFTAPNMPERSWTWRIVTRTLPDQPVSVAVDLVPALDGTSSQQLTHDFDVPAERRDLSWLIGLGVAAAIGVLLGLRLLWRRLRG